MGPNGESPHSISFHETHEWDPCLLHDGRVVYTRWDYVDRNAVHYQQLWSARPDGGNVRIFYGNNTGDPPGTWEPGPSQALTASWPRRAPTTRHERRLGGDAGRHKGRLMARSPDTAYLRCALPRV
jgi:hypothetical protein